MDDNDNERKIQELHEQDRQAVRSGGRQAVVIRYPKFEPDKRPMAMTMCDASPTMHRDLGLAMQQMRWYLTEYQEKYKCDKHQLIEWAAQAMIWANHLEQVREGLRRQLTRYEQSSVKMAEPGDN